MRLKCLVSAVTNRLYFGPFLSPARADYLRQLGVTHVLNVGEAPSVVNTQEKGFSRIVDCTLADLTRIPSETAIACIDSLRDILLTEEAKVYVHCIAGQNRSPTVLWLFLIACGVSKEKAKSYIESAAADAVAGHNLLVDADLVSLVQEYGRKHIASRMSSSDLGLF